MKLIVLLFLFLSCSTFSFKKEESGIDILEGYKKYTDIDYREHFESYRNLYLLDKKRDVKSLDYKSRAYLNSLILKLKRNNELFFKDSGAVSIKIINSKVPFHFSLPGGQIYLSSTLLEKYTSNETMLYSVLAYELIRTEKLIYNKGVIIPAGTISNEEMLSLLRLDTNSKLAIHKWAFYLLQRIGLDRDVYLSWLQLKNRNSLDFILQMGDIQSISREESLFKAFLIKRVQGGRKAQQHRSSSTKFYRFIQNIKGS